MRSRSISGRSRSVSMKNSGSGGEHPKEGSAAKIYKISAFPEDTAFSEDSASPDSRGGEISLPAHLAELVRGGGIVAFPTETVYGIAVRADDDAAIERVFRIKERDRGKPLTLHISDVAHVDPYVDWSGVSPEERDLFDRLVRKFWPGPLTVVLPKKSTVSDKLTGGRNTIAFRFPSHPVGIALIRACGGVVAGTSANLSGSLSTTTASAVTEELGAAVDAVVEADSGILGIESTVVALRGRIHILRQGAIGRKMLESVAGQENVVFERRAAAKTGRQGDAAREGIAEISVRGEGANSAGEAERTSDEAERTVAEDLASSHLRRPLKSKIVFYSSEEAARVFDELLRSDRVAAVLFKESLYYNITPVLQDKRVRARVRILSKEAFISKFYKILRGLHIDSLETVYIPLLEGEGIEESIFDLLTEESPRSISEDH